MNNTRCAVCGHVNRVGATACEMCDTRFAGGPAPGADSRGGPGAGGGFDGFGAGVGGFDGFGEERRAGALPTDVPSPQFKGVGDVVAPTLEVYRKHFVLVGLLVLATTLPLVVIQYVFADFFGGSFGVVGDIDRSGEAETGGIGAVAGGLGAAGGRVLYWLLTALGAAALSGALACAVVEIQRAGAARAGDCLRWGLAKMPKIFAVTAVVSLAVYGLPAVALTVLAAVIGPLAIILFLLMVLPWVVLTLTWSLAVPAAAVENRGVAGSLTRSAELTRGFKGLLFLTYFMWWVVVVVLKLVVSWSFAHGGAGDGSGTGLFTALVIQTLLDGMLNASMSVLTVYIFLGVLNERRQGFAAAAFAAGPGAR